MTGVGLAAAMGALGAVVLAMDPSAPIPPGTVIPPGGFGPRYPMAMPPGMVPPGSATNKVAEEAKAISAKDGPEKALAFVRARLTSIEARIADIGKQLDDSKKEMEDSRIRAVRESADLAKLTGVQPVEGDDPELAELRKKVAKLRDELVKAENDLQAKVAVTEGYQNRRKGADEAQGAARRIRQKQMDLIGERNGLMREQAEMRRVESDMKAQSAKPGPAPAAKPATGP
jgi:chromosome segregation ATPase